MIQSGSDPQSVRIVRYNGVRGLIRIPHTQAPAARIAWNAPSTGGDEPALRTVRSYGTLRKGKAWMRRLPGGAGADDRVREPE